MSAVRLINFISVSDYLSGEMLSEVRHEYHNGQVTATAGTSRNHNEATLTYTTISTLEDSLAFPHCSCV